MGQIYCVKGGLVPHHSRTEKLLAQFEEAHLIRRATNAKVDTLAGLAACLTILATGRRLLAPLLEALPESEEAFSIKIARGY